jgi:hypothetical protein
MKSIRYDDSAVFLLIVFEDRHKGAADRKAGTIQRVNQFCPSRPFSFEADTGPPGLEILKVAARGYLPVNLLPRKPDF